MKFGISTFVNSAGGEALTANASRLAAPSKVILYPIAAFSLIAALVHLWAAPEHFQEGWGYGTFFLIIALAQGLYGVLLVRWPNQKLLLAGILGNSAIILVYLLASPSGIPLFGPEGLGDRASSTCLQRLRKRRSSWRSARCLWRGSPNETGRSCSSAYCQPAFYWPICRTWRFSSGYSSSKLDPPITELYKKVLKKVHWGVRGSRRRA